MVRVLQRRLTLTSGRTIALRARTTTVPIRAELRIGRYGRVVDSATVAAGRQFTLAGTAPSGSALWLRVRRTDAGTERAWVAIGTVRAMRPALASWYGPGLYGRRTACGQTLTTGLQGVAHKSLPCGTRVSIRYRGRSTSAVVVDRGPFSGAREFDLTSATAQAWASAPSAACGCRTALRPERRTPPSRLRRPLARVVAGALRVVALATDLSAERQAPTCLGPRRWMISQATMNVTTGEKTREQAKSAQNPWPLR